MATTGEGGPARREPTNGRAFAGLVLPLWGGGDVRCPETLGSGFLRVVCVSSPRATPLIPLPSELTETQTPPLYNSLSSSLFTALVCPSCSSTQSTSYLAVYPHSRQD